MSVIAQVNSANLLGYDYTKENPDAKSRAICTHVLVIIKAARNMEVLKGKWRILVSCSDDS